jgi:hypothetical protein
MLRLVLIVSVLSFCATVAAVSWGVLPDPAWGTLGGSGGGVW